MNSNIIEMIGYTGSLLVLVSFLMVSVVKLRIVNTIGSLIFMIYALIIRSYPTAVMNFCLVLINLRYLYKTSKTDEKEYDLVTVNKTDRFLKYLLEVYHDDILSFFPNADLSLKDVNRIYVVCHENKPVGITAGNKEEKSLALTLDYVTPEYRDFSIGNYLFGKLKEEGLQEVIFTGDTAFHQEYLTKFDFREKDGAYVKKL